MNQALTLAVSGETTHRVPMHRLNALQDLIRAFGMEAYPLLARLGAVRSTELQPVSARSLLAEVERIAPLIHGRRIPGISFLDGAQHEIGGIFGGDDEAVIAATDEASLSVTPGGIRVTLRQFPPPVGFRSSPSLESGWFECYFESLHFGPNGTSGQRTPAMGGSGAPVPLDRLPPLPPPTRWDYARVSGSAAVAAAEFTETPAEEVYRDLLHAITAACTASLRLRRPVQIRRDH